LFWARDTADPGGFAPARGLSRGLFPGATLAQRTDSAQKTHRQKQREEEQESGAEATLARGASGFQGGFMKNLPVKAPPPPLRDEPASLLVS
jgi:hypothetical protein